MKTKKALFLTSAATLATGMAHGAVQYSGPVNALLTGTNSYWLDLNQDSTTDYRIWFDDGATGTKPFVDSRHDVNSNLNTNAWVLSKANGGAPVTASGTMIDASYAAAFQTNRVGHLYKQWDSGTVVGDWSSSSITDAYVGLELVNGSSVNYGWVQLIYDPTLATPSLTVVDFAYETSPNTGLVTASVPEPATLSLVGIGALLVARRIRKSKPE